MSAYSFERDEWRSALRTMTDADRDRIRDAERAQLGIVGDRDDARNEIPCDGDDED